MEPPTRVGALQESYSSYQCKFILCKSLWWIQILFITAFISDSDAVLRSIRARDIERLDVFLLIRTTPILHSSIYIRSRIPRNPRFHIAAVVVFFFGVLSTNARMPSLVDWCERHTVNKG
jgi:hypothetical protein